MLLAIGTHGLIEVGPNPFDLDSRWENIGDFHRDGGRATVSTDADGKENADLRVRGERQARDWGDRQLGVANAVEHDGKGFSCWESGGVRIDASSAEGGKLGDARRRRGRCDVRVARRAEKLT